jgi:hypothetical protein
MAERIGVGQQLFHEGLIHHHHALRGCRIGSANVATREQRNSQHMQIVRANLIGAQRHLAE